MGALYLLSLRQLFGRWRLLIMTVLAAMPVLFTRIVVTDRRAPSVGEFEQVVLDGMLAGSITPLVVLAIAGAAFSNEIEDKTLANLILAPIPRWQIAGPKLLAAITIAGVFMGVGALLTAHQAYLGDTRATVAVTAGILIEVALYASVFVWLGLVTTRTIGAGLLYIVLWEGFFTAFVPGVRLFSIGHYAVSLMHSLDPRRFAGEQVMGAGAVTVTAVLVFVGFLALAVRRLRRMDVP